MSDSKPMTRLSNNENLQRLVDAVVALNPTPRERRWVSLSLCVTDAVWSIGYDDVVAAPPPRPTWSLSSEMLTGCSTPSLRGLARPRLTHIRTSSPCASAPTGWGADARIQSGFVRRRDAVREAWRPEWEELFTYQEGGEIKESSMTEVRASYDRLLAALVEDVELLEPRDRYADSDVVINAR